MPILSPYPYALQATANSCWASAGRSITNWYRTIGRGGTTPYFGSDEAFANAWAAATNDAQHANIDVQQSAAAALGDLSFDNCLDSCAFPTPSEIYDAINLGEPLLAIVADNRPDPSPNPAVTNGHWVVIIGISSNQPDATVNVFDPDDGLIHNVSYDSDTYQPGVYWQNTSYVSEYSPYKESNIGALHATEVQSAPAVPSEKTVPSPSTAVSTAASTARSSTSSGVPAPATSPVPITWTGTARGDVTIEVTCQPEANSASAKITIEQTDGPGRGRRQQVTLGLVPGIASQGIWQFGEDDSSIEFTLIVRRTHAPVSGTPDMVHLWALYPETQSTAARRIIAAWPIEASLA